MVYLKGDQRICDISKALENALPARTILTVKVTSSRNQIIRPLLPFRCFNILNVNVFLSVILLIFTSFLPTFDRRLVVVDCIKSKYGKLTISFATDIFYLNSNLFS